MMTTTTATRATIASTPGSKNNTSRSIGAILCGSRPVACPCRGATRLPAGRSKRYATGCVCYDARRDGPRPTTARLASAVPHRAAFRLSDPGRLLGCGRETEAVLTVPVSPSPARDGPGMCQSCPAGGNSLVVVSSARSRGPGARGYDRGGAMHPRLGCWGETGCVAWIRLVPFPSRAPSCGAALRLRPVSWSAMLPAVSAHGEAGDG